MATQGAPPEGVTLDANPVPAGVTLDTSSVPAGVTLDQSTQPQTPPVTLDTRTKIAPHSFGDVMQNEALGWQDLKDAVNRQVVGGYALTAGKILRAIPGVGDALSKHTNLDANIANAQAAASKPYPTDPDRAKDQEAYEHLMSVAEYMMLYGVAKQGLSYLESMKMTAPVVQALEKSPVAARIVGEAVKQGGAGGAQTLIHGGTPKEAVINAGINALIGGGLEAVGPTKMMEGKRAQPRTIAGATFETMPKTGEAMLRNMADVKQDPATQAVDEALGNVGKTAVLRSVARSVAERPTGMSRILAEDRRLPAPEGSAQGYRVGGSQPGETTPIKEGEILQPARKKQIGTRVVEGKGSPTGVPEYQGTGFTGEEPPPPPREVAEPPTQSGSHREPLYQYLTSAKPGTPTAAEGETGQGILFLTKDGQAASVPRMRQQLAQYDRIMDDPEIWDELPQRQKDAIQADHEDLTEQLHRYGDYAAAQPHFPTPDPVEMVRNTHSLGDAAAQLKGEHGQFWDVADEASQGDFTDLRDEEKRLRKQIFGETPTGRLDELRTQLKDNQQRQLDFFDRFRDKVSPQEWKIAREGYQDGIVLQNLDDLFQRRFRGISQAEEQRGLAQGVKRQREFKPDAGFTQELEDFYNDGYRDTATNRQVLERTMGQQHMDDLKDLSLLFRDAQRREAAQTLRTSIASAIMRHYHGIKGILAAGGGAGMIAAHATGAGLGVAGVPLMTGTAAGVRNYVVERLLTDPNFARKFTYAVNSKVPPRTAGSLLASQIIGSQVATSGKNEPGNIDLKNRPVVKNDDGTSSTEYSTSFQDEDGREVLVPTVVDGKFLTPDGKKPPEGSEEEKHMFRRARAHYRVTGEHLGKFRSVEEANAYAEALHKSREAETGR